jgi:hypothetical protein
MLVFGRRKRDIPMIVIQSRLILLAGVLAHLVMSGLFFGGAGFAQTAPNPQADAAAVTEPQQPPSEAPPQRRSGAPGLFGALGEWVDDSIGRMTSGWNNARDTVGGLGDRANEAAKGAADVARDAAASVVRLPTTSIVTGRAHCVRTASGGPDCVAATEALCRSKGYAAGSSLHIQSEQKCPVWGWIAGQKPVGKCGTETYVTSAMCR